MRKPKCHGFVLFLLFISVFLSMFSVAAFASELGKMTKPPGTLIEEQQDPTEYTVRFVNWENSVLQESTLRDGQIPVYHFGTPIRPADDVNIYTFSAWDKGIVAVGGVGATNPVVYTAQYTPQAKASVEYTLTMNRDNATISMGDTLNLSVTCSPAGMVSGSLQWASSNPGVAVVDPAGCVTALSAGTTVISCTDGGALCHGASMTLTVVPPKVAITWVVDGVSTQTLCAIGEAPVYTVNGVSAIPTKAPTADKSYTFVKWNVPIVPCAGAATYVAEFSEGPRTYTVKWDFNGTIDTEEYSFGQVPSYKKSTARESSNTTVYTFNGWTPEVGSVTGDVTYVAKFKEETRMYTVQFKDWNGSLLRTDRLEYNSVPNVSKIITVRASEKNSLGKTISYKFAGWSPAIKKVTENATYVATYTASDGVNSYYEVEFRGYNNKLLYECDVKAGNKAAYDGATPVCPIGGEYRYVFVGWTPSIDTPIYADTVFTAEFKKADANSYRYTSEELLKASKDDNVTVLEFRYGTLYLPPNVMRTLSAMKESIDISLGYTKKTGELNVVFTRSKSGTKIYSDLGDMTLKSDRLTDGNVVLVKSGKSTTFFSEPLSVIEKDVGYVVFHTSSVFCVDYVSNNFLDVGGRYWATSEIDFCFSHGIVNGFSMYEFSPELKVTRAQAVTMMHRVDSQISSVGGKAYKDVNPYEWYSPAVFWAISNNLLPVYSESQNLYGPNEEITRADQALLLYNFAKKMGLDVSGSERLSRFYDTGYVKTADQLSAISWAVASGIIQGDNSGRLRPNDGASRAEFCAMVERFIEWAIVPA